MKIYIAGKITGDENYREKFATAEKALSERGHVILNPAILPAGLDEQDYMQIALAMLTAAELVVFLPDYVESLGARIEMTWCMRVGKPYALYLGEGNYEYD